ncbi:MAG: LysM peptidoglycan-binding domain-containing protein [Cyanobacteria bacterium SIG26]|nr:LysM peptidoglycan-binding domain-containing protein [Cyanobacteria bacterium SIG26]
MVNRVGSNVFQKVEIKYKDKTVNVRFEKGCIFENKAKKYVVDNNGDLSVFDKSTKTWSRADYIGMTEYQFNAFRAMANNKFEDKDVITYSKEDIKIANQKYKNDGFLADMGQFLGGTGYKAVATASNPSELSMGVKISNGIEKQSGYVTFSVANSKQSNASKSSDVENNNVSDVDDGEKTILDKLSSLPYTEEKLKNSSNIYCMKFKYKVEAGDSIYSIARRYSIDPKTLMANNNMNNNSKLSLGQTIIIPKIVYKVQNGDTLYKIASEFGYNYEVLQDENNIEKSHDIKIGQKIDIPGYLYTVKKGDNLTQIAKRAGMSIDVLKKINGLKNSDIAVGQNLVILFNDGTYNTPEVSETPPSKDPKKNDKPTSPDLNNDNIISNVGKYPLLAKPQRRNGRVVATTKTFSPTKEGPLSGHTIVVNAGHGYKANGVLDCGATHKASKRDEVFINYDNAMMLKDQLCNQGANVIFIQGSKSLVQSEINKNKAIQKADLFISVHTNSLGREVKDRTQIFCRNSGGTSKMRSESKKLANIMEDKFDAWIPKNEHIKSKDKFIFQGKQDYAQVSANDGRTGILKTPMNYNIPAVLWEVAYISDDKGRERLNNKSLMQNYSRLMMQSIVQYLP